MANVSQSESNFNPAEHLMQLKGKDYLQVMWRLVWFRDTKANWCIDTEALRVDDKGALFSAKIYDENGVLKSSGHGSETPKDFGDYIEKAETKAIGRALAMLGYGTQFAPELDEGERIVDSPVEKKKDDAPYYKCEDCGTIIKGYKKGDRQIGAMEWTEYTKNMKGATLCLDCFNKRVKNNG